MTHRMFHVYRSKAQARTRCGDTTRSYEFILTRAQASKPLLWRDDSPMADAVICVACASNDGGERCTPHLPS